mmetsp:Transcript_15525/g.33698  ORF Transcript_15525/g.33698 Transcript_15525/m.33698 type:complete len:222 (-) Transcript_15525:405-1070(-)
MLPCLECMLSPFQGVAQQHGNRHGAHTTRHWGDVRRLLRSLLIRHVPHQPVALLAAGVIHGVDAHVNDCCPGLDPRALHHLGLTACSNHNVRLSADLLSVGCPGVHHGDGGIAVLEQQGRWQAHDVGAAHHHGPLAGNGDLVALQQLNAALGCAGHEQGVAPPHGQAADVLGVEAVHILLDADGVQDGLLVDVLGQRQLDQDAVDLGVSVVPLDHLQHVLL